jgi:putative ABC transport system permease protein
MRISGEGRFLYLARQQRAAAVALPALQSMSGESRRDRASLFMVRVKDGGDVEAVRGWIATNIESVTATTIEGALKLVDERLSYFRQMAFILGSVSLVVGFLLVTTLVTVSVNERVGEIAVPRAIGISRTHSVQQVMIEALALCIPGIVVGLLLGLITARYLNGILSTFPGVPLAIDFFLFQPAAAWRALGMLIVSGVAASIYPAWRAASLPIAGTLRREAIA